MPSTRVCAVPLRHLATDFSPFYALIAIVQVVWLFIYVSATTGCCLLPPLLSSRRRSPPPLLLHSPSAVDRHRGVRPPPGLRPRLLWQRAAAVVCDLHPAGPHHRSGGRHRSDGAPHRSRCAQLPLSTAAAAAAAVTPPAPPSLQSSCSHSSRPAPQARRWSRPGGAGWAVCWTRLWPHSCS